MQFGFSGKIVVYCQSRNKIKTDHSLLVWLLNYLALYSTYGSYLCINGTKTSINFKFEKIS